MAVTHKLMVLAAAAVLLFGALSLVQYRQMRTLIATENRLAEIFIPKPDQARHCPWRLGGNPLMVLVLGQSNAGNHGAIPETLVQPATFIFEGRCYMSTWPVPGATGRGGSIWPNLAPLLSRATGREVVFSVLAVESTSVAEWVEPGPLQSRLLQTLRQGREQGFVPDLVLWQQGEADAHRGTSASDYSRRFSRLIAELRQQGINAPVIVALSTRCHNQGSESIRAVLREAAMTDSSIRLGPDTDALGGEYRYDGCHLSTTGQRAAAELWFRAIMASLLSPISMTNGRNG